MWKWRPLFRTYRTVSIRLTAILPVAASHKSKFSAHHHVCFQVAGLINRLLYMTMPKMLISVKINVILSNYVCDANSTRMVVK
jgi:hypothetical protein